MSRKSELPFYRRRNLNDVKRSEAEKSSGEVHNELSPVYVTLEERRAGRTMVVRPLSSSMQISLQNNIDHPSYNQLYRRGEITNMTTKSNIPYVSVPVIDLDPHGQISKWLNFAQQSLQKRRTEVSNTPQRTHEETADKKSHMLGAEVLGRIQSPEDVNNVYTQHQVNIPQVARNELRQQDEVDEDEEEEEEEGGYNRDRLSVRSELQRGSDSFDYRSAAAQSSSVQGMRENSFAYGNRRNGRRPIVFEREVGFGPISVEAKTADAPPDSASED